MGTSSSFTLSPIEQTKLWKPDLSIVELRKQVTMDDSAKDHDTNLALARVVMLLDDVADLIAEGSKEIRDLLIMH